MKNIIAFIIAIILLGAISWITTCGIIALICLCFNLVFSWKIATGIWLILFLIGGGIRCTIKR